MELAIQQLTKLQLEGGSADPRVARSPSDPAGAADDAAAHADRSAKTTSGSPASPASHDADAGKLTADQWVDVTVSEMAASADMPDARRRATKILHAFELFAKRRAEESASSEVGALKKTVAELARDNAVLKRAVTIQSQRMAEVQQKDAEIAELKRMVEASREEVRALEMTNYSLSVHLRQAFSPAPDQRPPDVF